MKRVVQGVGVVVVGLGATIGVKHFELDGARVALAAAGTGMLLGATSQLTKAFLGRVVATRDGEVRRRARALVLNGVANCLLAVAEMLVPKARRAWFNDAWHDIRDVDPGWPRVVFAIGVAFTSLAYRFDPSSRSSSVKDTLPAPVTSRSTKVVVTVETPGGPVRVEVAVDGDDRAP